MPQRGHRRIRISGVPASQCSEWPDSRQNSLLQAFFVGVTMLGSAFPNILGFFQGFRARLIHVAQRTPPKTEVPETMKQL